MLVARFDSSSAAATVPFSLPRIADRTRREDGMLLEGKVAIVSGVGPGLGQATALALTREGASVVLAARNESYLKEVSAEIEERGGRPLPVATDVTDPEQCGRLADAAASEFGGLDVVVNNAFRYDPTRPFEEVDLAEWRQVYEVNVFGSLQLTKATIPHLKSRGGGSVVFVNSMSARKIRFNEGGYASSKGALLTAVQVLAKELGSHQIRVNSVVPGWIWGPPVQGYVAWQAQQRGVSPDDVVAEIVAEIPLGAIPPQEDVANAIVFFASDLARWVTGQALDVNGGEWFH
jgi:NAD(P)-dependent dehydrogenase (short-subunit alcohol dehydrogenase family)